MNVDIRIPIGGMFSIVGLLLVVFGLLNFNSVELYNSSLGNNNVNLFWGLAMVAFGGIMLYFGIRAKPKSS
jgi:hypothetical protein